MCSVSMYLHLNVSVGLSMHACAHTYECAHEGDVYLSEEASVHTYVHTCMHAPYYPFSQGHRKRGRGPQTSRSFKTAQNIR